MELDAILNNLNLRTHKKYSMLDKINEFSIASKENIRDKASQIKDLDISIMTSKEINQELQQELDNHNDKLTALKQDVKLRKALNEKLEATINELKNKKHVLVLKENSLSKSLQDQSELEEIADLEKRYYFVHSTTSLYWDSKSLPNKIQGLIFKDDIILPLKFEQNEDQVGVADKIWEEISSLHRPG